jgi:histidyl-tRNA synthetase
METQRCKGTQDLLPGDMTRFRHIEEAFRSCCLKWGYKEVRTPTLEYLQLFTSTGTLTPGMLSKVYSFLDWNGWSGERVVLRPEGTIPVTRLYIENMEKNCPAKLFYVENVFNFEETGKESRERWQCGVELIGSDEPTADVELILLALEVLGRLGLDEVELSLFHAGLIRALLQELELAPAEQSQIFDRILDGDIDMAKGLLSADPRFQDSLPLLLELEGNSPGFLKNLKASLGGTFPNLGPSIDNFINIANLLSTMGREYQVDVTSGKGFEYYTGVIFQIFLDGQKVGGGGRYNDLIPLLGGGKVPASGFALNIDKLIDCISPEVWKGEIDQRILVQTEVNTDELRGSSFEAVSLLQEARYVAELDHGYKGKTDHRWVLRVRGGGKGSPYLLIDQVSKKETEANSVAEILAVLKEMECS